MKMYPRNALSLLLVLIILPILAHAQWNANCSLGSFTSVPQNLGCGFVASNPGAQTVTGGGTKTSGPFTITAPSSVPPGSNPEHVTVVFNPSTSGEYSANVQFSYSPYTLTVNLSSNYLDTSTFDPKYKVVSVLYSPPGNGSNQGYGNSTTHGTSTTIGNSFTFSQTMSFSSGIPDVLSGGASTGFSTTTGESNEFTQTWTDATTVTTNDNSNKTWNPTQSNAINHNLDEFAIWLNPQVLVYSYGSNPVTPVSYTTNSQATPGISAIVADVVLIPAITMEPKPGSISKTNPSGISTVPVSDLIPQAIATDSGGTAYMPGLGAICKNNSLYQQQLAHPTQTICTLANQCGCAPSDFVAVLQEDPLLNYNGTTYTANPYAGTTDPLTLDESGVSVCAQNPIPAGSDCRYWIVPIDAGSTTTQFEKLSGAASFGFTQSDSTSTTHTTMQSDSNSVGVSFSAGPVVASLKIEDTWTWTNSESNGTTNGESSSMSVLFSSSTAACDENVSIYEDLVYHTYVFQVPTGNLGCN